MRPESDNTGNPSTSVGAANPQAGSDRPLPAAAIPNTARESAPAGPQKSALGAMQADAAKLPKIGSEERFASLDRSRIGLSETAPSALRPQRQHLGAAGAVVPNEEPAEARPASLREVEQEG